MEYGEWGANVVKYVKMKRMFEEVGGGQECSLKCLQGLGIPTGASQAQAQGSVLEYTSDVLEYTPAAVQRSMCAVVSTWI